MVSLAIPVAIIAVIYLLSSLTHKVEDWQTLKKQQPKVEKSLTVEIDKSGVE